MGYPKSIRPIIERFFALFEANKHSLPNWLITFEHPSPGEVLRGVDAVLLTRKGRMLVRLEDKNGGIDQFNRERPRNRMLVLLLPEHFSPERFMDKALDFIGREYARL